MAELRIQGVRHHSPACARLVAHLIEQKRPRFVLIEGPCDMNDRIGELALDHKSPIAIYSYLLSEVGEPARGTWTPFCDYSPEWVALRRGLASGAEVSFIDLPAWDPAFREVKNRYADGHLEVHEKLLAVARARGFDSTDTLWDHMFEQPKPLQVLERDLAVYFEAYRGEDGASERDERREAFMAQHIAWAMSRARSDECVLVICGGFHAPALARLWTTKETTKPEPETPSGRTGSYLVPYSFRRLDSFTGYSAGMPSPGFYQAVWERGEGAPDEMLFGAVERLRKKGQRISTADVLAASELSQGLADLRGHSTRSRADILDGIVGAFFKDALAFPPPWTVREVLPRGTDPMLVEVVAAFSGDARGELAQGTPRPPLVADVESELASAGVEVLEEARTLSIDPFDAKRFAARRALHRLALLEIPGVTLLAAPDLRRGVAVAEERWRLQRMLETEAALIERALYGATLREAGRAKIVELLQVAEGAAEVVVVLEHALLAGYGDAAAEIGKLAAVALERDPSLASVGAALERLLTIARVEPLLTIALDELIVGAVERASWLCEGRDGSSAAYSKAEVHAVRALRSALGFLRLGAQDRGEAEPVSVEAAVGVLYRRAHAESAPPWLRGAALGALWSLDPTARDGKAALSAARAIATPALGDFLVGLFVLAREEVLGSSLLTVIDERLREVEEADFLGALPSLRNAFAQFPPHERLGIAKRVVRDNASNLDAGSLLEPGHSTETLARAAGLENRIVEIAERYGLFEVRR